MNKSGFFIFFIFLTISLSFVSCGARQLSSIIEQTNIFSDNLNMLGPAFDDFTTDRDNLDALIKITEDVLSSASDFEQFMGTQEYDEHLVRIDYMYRNEYIPALNKFKIKMTDLTALQEISDVYELNNYARNIKREINEFFIIHNDLVDLLQDIRENM